MGVDDVEASTNGWIFKKVGRKNRSKMTSLLNQLHPLWIQVRVSLSFLSLLQSKLNNMWEMVDP